jgi:hypothetical protein
MLTTNLKTWGFAGLCLLCLRCAFSCVPIAASVRHDKYPIVKRTDNGVRFPLPLQEKLPTHLLQGGHHLKKFLGASHMCLPACLRFESPQDCTAMMDSLWHNCNCNRQSDVCWGNRLWARDHHELDAVVTCRA